MTEKIIYVAFDGAEYEDKNECLEYEANIQNLADEIYDKCTFFDNRMDTLEIDKDSGLQEYIDSIYDVWNKCHVVQIFDKLSYKADYFMRHNLGCYVPEEKGLYHINIYGEWEIDG